MRGGLLEKQSSGWTFSKPQDGAVLLCPFVLPGFSCKLLSLHVSFWANTSTCLYVSECIYLSHMPYADLLHSFTLGGMCHNLTLKTWRVGINISTHW